eukprot:gnl/TRDRNA2_/TRDRNA2_150972_c0_seq1.p1 gnl/TRDRNA2_/TRDRNA2_150972_c0~~gnl/TRDRNA2_/TRDRNA2_150972_c0_seq1.p1  ORF type:complete len:316 (+),score=46.42 gnl/TRDRNA2_/TRDRNA2_150972_c0_seq1:10-957(+)
MHIATRLCRRGQGRGVAAWLLFQAVKVSRHCSTVIAASLADRLSLEQIAELAHVLRGAGGEPIKGTGQVVRVLREKKPSAFSAEDIESVAAAISQLDVPLEARLPWPAAKKRGPFFVFEGLDRSGKSTQSKLLVQHLHQAGPVKWLCFPNRTTPIGLLIDLYLRKKIELHDETIHLLFSANRWETAKTIVEDLNKGTAIVCDRYAFSGVAYSAAKGLDFDWCRGPDRGLPTPDGVFYLHVNEEEGASRAGYGDERYENSTMQSRVRVEFGREELRRMDAGRSIDVIHAEICRKAKEAASGSSEDRVKPIPSLWTV